MDGKRVEMGRGEVSFGGDQNTKPDAKGRKGHRSGTVGNEPSVNLIVQLEKNPFVRGQDSASNATKAPLVTQMSLVTPCETDSACTAEKQGRRPSNSRETEVMEVRVSP